MLNRNFLLILCGNVILGSAMPMLIILGSLAGSALASKAWMATMPPSAQMLAGIVVATPISLFMGRYGRRQGFLLSGFLVVCGGLMAVLAFYLHSFLLLLLSHIILGAALIGVSYFRFTAAETVIGSRQAQAISLTMASGLVAALIGPQVFSISKDWLAPLPYAGAYLAISGLGGAGMIVVAALTPLQAIPLRPNSHTGMRWRAVTENPAILRAVAIAAISQGMMVLLMTPTPLAMVSTGFATEQTADVIRWHVLAMFAPGLITGKLIERFGSGRIAAIGFVFLTGAALIALSGIQLMHFYGALIVLGLGWNFGFIGGTHMLQAATTPEQRPLVQGVNDTILSISAASASLLAGVAFVGVGWLGLALLSAPLIPIAGLAMLGIKQR